MAGAGFSLEGWRISITGSPTALLLAAEVLWPEFVDIEGRVYPLVPRTSEGELRDHLLGRVGPRLAELGAAEAAELGEVDLGVVLALPLTADDDLDASLVRVAEVLRLSWLAAVESRFPGRRFVVRVEPPDGHAGPTISVTEVRAGAEHLGSTSATPDEETIG